MTPNTPAGERWRRLLGIEASPVSHRERWVAAIGGFVAIAAVYATSRALLGASASLIMLFSMGSTAAMLFAVPHGTLSQPWPLFGGHLVSGLIGVACLLWVPDPLLAGSLATGLSLGAMHYLRCLHPPAGATTLAAALGGDTVRALGFGFVLAPLMLNVLIIFIIAVAFNALFPWRRYPAALAATPPPAPAASPAAISHEDFVYALSQVDTFVDVSEDDLLRIYALATGRRADAAGAEPLNRADPP